MLRTNLFDLEVLHEIHHRLIMLYESYQAFYTCLYDCEKWNIDVIEVRIPHYGEITYEFDIKCSSRNGTKFLKIGIFNDRLHYFKLRN